MFYKKSLQGEESFFLAFIREDLLVFPEFFVTNDSTSQDQMTVYKKPFFSWKERKRLSTHPDSSWLAM